MEPEIGTGRPQVVKVTLDVLDDESVEWAAREVDDAFRNGGLDILVNNAGWTESVRVMGEG